MRKPVGLAIALLLLISALLPGCDLANPFPAAQPGSGVPTFVAPTTATPSVSGTQVVVRRGTITGVVKARARVVAAEQADLSFALSGYLKSITMTVGAQVDKGTLLAELDTSDLEDQLQDAEQQLALSQLELQRERLSTEAESAELERLRIAMEKAAIAVQAAQRRYDDTGGSFDPKTRDTPPAVALQQATLDYLYAKSQYEGYLATRVAGQRLVVEAAERRVALAEHQVERVKGRLEAARLYAPFPGMIVSVDARPGDAINPFAPIGALANPTVMAIEASVPETDSVYVVVGQKASVVLDGFPQDTFEAQVSAIAAKPTTWQGRSVYEVTLSFAPSAKVPATFRMGADVAIITRVQPNVLIVPSAAIYVLEKRSYVDVMESGKKRRAEIETGLVGQTETEVISGLKEGDRVLIP